VLFVVILSVPAFSQNLSQDYSRLIDFIRIKDRTTPLYPFSDYEKGFDPKFQKDNIRYFNSHPALIQRIRKNLEGPSIKWRLAGLSQRLLFVPEKRKEYALLYESYCRKVIDTVLAATQQQNPYVDMRTLSDPEPRIKEGGITAFLVHNLARKYVATYIFSNPQNKRVQIKLEGTEFSGDIGSYRSTIYQKENGSFEFEKDAFTVWQNSAENPYTALTVPVEETFHILLRDSTDAAILRQIESENIRSLSDVKKISAEWIAVEEAIVGGLVRSLLPEFLNGHFKRFPMDLIARDMQSKSELKRYRYLPRGVEWVKKYGATKAVERYKKDPYEFRNDLLQWRKV